MMASLNFGNVDNTMANFLRLKEYVERGMRDTIEVATDLENAEELTEEVKELKDVMLGYASLDREFSVWKKAMDKTKRKVERERAQDGGNSLDLEKEFEECLNELEANKTDTDLNKHPMVVKFVEKIWKQHHAESEIADDQDEDILISQVVGDELLCPITKHEKYNKLKKKVPLFKENEFASSPLIQHKANIL